MSTMRALKSAYRRNACRCLPPRQMRFRLAIDRSLHALSCQRPGVLDLLLADPAEARVDRRIVDVAREMPLILAPTDYVRPMRMWPISTRVNKPENDDPSIIEPIGLSVANAQWRRDVDGVGVLRKHGLTTPLARAGRTTPCFHSRRIRSSSG
jgi:hypothetical protein